MLSSSVFNMLNGLSFGKLFFSGRRLQQCICMCSYWDNPVYIVLRYVHKKFLSNSDTTDVGTTSCCHFITEICFIFVESVLLLYILSRELMRFDMFLVTLFVIEVTVLLILMYVPSIGMGNWFEQIVRDFLHLSMLKNLT